jgi:hypothetical protein
MTLDDYKAECQTMVNGIPPGAGAMPEFFMIIRLNKLYELALDGTENESKECLDHWSSLPVEERLKQEVLSQWERSKE